MARTSFARARIDQKAHSRSGSALTLALAVALMATLAVSGCSSPASTTPSEPAKTEAPATQPAPSTPAPAEQATGLKMEDTVVGTGAEAKPGDTVTVHYTGYLTDGTKFDSSLDSGQPFQFTIGQGRVIPGWEQGIPGMKVGGKRKLTIPPELGYGAQGAGSDIPPNATLVFEVELLAVN
jgi:FKBP-type peptidyl-prolyl cis-trans isomerase